jgi:hypothetical protein
MSGVVTHDLSIGSNSTTAAFKAEMQVLYVIIYLHMYIDVCLAVEKKSFKKFVSFQK